MEVEGHARHDTTAIQGQRVCRLAGPGDLQAPTGLPAKSHPGVAWGRETPRSRCVPEHMKECCRSALKVSGVTRGGTTGRRAGPRWPPYGPRQAGGGLGTMAGAGGRAARGRALHHPGHGGHARAHTAPGTTPPTHSYVASRGGGTVTKHLCPPPRPRDPRGPLHRHTLQGGVAPSLQPLSPRHPESQVAVDVTRAAPHTPAAAGGTVNPIQAPQAAHDAQEGAYGRCNPQRAA